jgi:hypothetical protein
MFISQIWTQLPPVTYPKFDVSQLTDHGLQTSPCPRYCTSSVEGSNLFDVFLCEVNKIIMTINAHHPSTNFAFIKIILTLRISPVWYKL